MLINTMTAFVPAAAFGLVCGESIRAHIFGLWPVVAAWLVGGLAILAVAWKMRHAPPREGCDLEHLTWKCALIIGLLQCLAIWPGTSRSLVTIVGGVLVGMNMRSAVIFSFLLGVVTLGAVTVYDSIKHGPLMVETYSWASILVGCVVATVSAMFAVKWMMAYLKKHGLEVFGYYRVALALVVGTLLYLGILNS